MRRLIAIAASLTLGGCVADNGPARKFPVAPSDAQATRISVSLGQPTDTDANGYVDTIDIAAQLFNPPYPLALTVEGSWLFRMISNRDRRTLVEWNFDREQTAASIRGLAAGTGYLFRLNLNDAASDQFPAQQADVLAIFTPTNGEPLKASAVTIRIGHSPTNTNANIKPGES